mgnify:CR=1 FL=1
MGSLFADPSIGDHQNLICLTDGIQAVCNHKQCFPFYQFIDCLLDIAFIIGINTCSRFIQNDNRCVLQNAAGERDSLLFRQMEKVGLAPSDSIPDDLYPDILRLDLDSALYVFGEISVYRSSPDSAYTVSYMGGGYYLKKRVSLPTRNK